LHFVLLASLGEGKIYTDITEDELRNAIIYIMK